MKKEYLGLIAILGIILVVLFSIIIFNQWPIMVGKKMVLATLPIDPFDPFMGQYMMINYEISQIDNEKSFIKGDEVYVSLEEGRDGIWRKTKSSNQKPLEGDFIRGKVNDNGRIEFGIERYYFERDASMPTRNISVEVMVSGSGRAKITRLLHEGKPVEIKYVKKDITS